LVCDDRPVTRKEYYTQMAKILGTAEPRFEPPRPETPDSARDSTNKRINNNRIKTGLRLALVHPDLESGLPGSLQARDHA
jgi:hypothetical protein